MNKYLLSSGTSTTDIVKYVKDLLLLHLRIPEDSIPMFQFGSPQIITSIVESDVETSIRNIISTIINNINSEYKNVNISITSISINNNIVNAVLNINNKIAKYSISI